MSNTEFHHYTRDEFLGEFFPDLADKAEIAAGMEQLRAEQRAWRLAEMRRRLGITQAEVAERMGVTQGRVSAMWSRHSRRSVPTNRSVQEFIRGDRRLDRLHAVPGEDAVECGCEPWCPGRGSRI